MNCTVINAFQTLSGYTRRATKKAIKELEESIKDPRNRSVATQLQSRKQQLEKALKVIENYMEEI